MKYRVHHDSTPNPYDSKMAALAAAGHIERETGSIVGVTKESKKWTVKVIMETDLTAEIEAETEEEAWRKAENLDGAAFVENGLGNWIITSVEEVNV